MKMVAMKKKVDKRQGAANSKHAELAFLTNMTSKEQIGTEQQKNSLRYIFLVFFSRLTPFHHCQKTNETAILQNTRFF